MNWAQAIVDLYSHGERYCLVTVMTTKGSSPRETGSKMVVSKNGSYDTIGGGSLEHIATHISRALISTSGSKQYIRTFDLGKDLKQCCGGVVTLLFESFERSIADLVVFGAGHIGRELIPILSSLDFRIQWFDSREKVFPAQIPHNVTTRKLDKLELDVDSCPSDAHYLIMTHDHAVDQALCEAIISREDAAFCGLIGSRSKQLKFNKRLAKKGFTKAEISTITCPIGLPMVVGKKPAEIAVSVAAQLLAIKGNLTEPDAVNITSSRKPLLKAV